jgi:predicted acylesterase/phospholipase RssA
LFSLLSDEKQDFMGNEMLIDLSKVHSVIFSGGGSRCLWQCGFWKILKEMSKINPVIIGSTSAGATMACLLLAGQMETGLEYFKDKTRENKKNVYLSNLFTSRPVFPHYQIYRQAILDIIDSDGLERLKNGPEIRVLIARPPKWLGPRSGSFIGILLYALEKRIKYPVHPTLTVKFGFQPLVTTVRQCNSVEELADLLLQSSCTPPFVPVLKREGRPVLDGGMIDNVPVSLADETSGKTLVLLSRQYPKHTIPDIPNRYYLQPSSPISVSKWDFTNPEGLQEAYNLGKEDANSFLRQNS